MYGMVVDNVNNVTSFLFWENEIPVHFKLHGTVMDNVNNVTHILFGMWLLIHAGIIKVKSC